MSAVKGYVVDGVMCQFLFFVLGCLEVVLLFCSCEYEIVVRAAALEVQFHIFFKFISTMHEK